jgi:hypothetical protein
MAVEGRLGDRLPAGWFEASSGGSTGCRLPCQRKLAPQPEAGLDEEVAHGVPERVVTAVLAALEADPMGQPVLFGHAESFLVELAGNGLIYEHGSCFLGSGGCLASSEEHRHI